MRVSKHFLLLPMHYIDSKMNEREYSFKDKLEVGKQSFLCINIHNKEFIAFQFSM